MGARKDVKYSVYNKGNFLIGNCKTLRAANKLMKRKDAKMLTSIKKSSKTFSGYVTVKVLRRK